MKLFTRMREEREKGEEQLDEDRRKLDDALEEAEGKGQQGGGGAGDMADAGAEGQTESAGDAATRGAESAAKLLVERWGEQQRFEKLIRKLILDWYDGGRQGDAPRLARSWADMPGKRAQVLAMGKNGDRDGWS